MARTSIRELFRFRGTITPSKPILSSSYSSSTLFLEDRAISCNSPILLILKTCQTLRQLFQIQAHFITSGLFHNPFWSSRVLGRSSEYGNIDYTILIFQSMDSPNTFCVNTVIKAYSFSSVPHQAVVFYFESLRNGIFPNSYTFVPLIGACARMICVESGKKCHGQAVKNAVDFVLPVQNSLIHMYACCGVVEFARKVFDEMSDRDLVSWNSIVDGYARYGNLRVAHRIFDIMPARNVVSYNIMVGGYLKGGIPGTGLKLYREMVRSGMKGNSTTMVSILTACGRSARIKEGRSVHGSLIRNFMRSNIILEAALIDLYSRCQRVEIARRVFDRMESRNLVSWNAMILGHCIHGNPDDGINLFEEMVCRTGFEDRETNPDNSLRPDEITFIGVLCACARGGLLLKGRNYFSQMNDVFCVRPTFAHYWCMANLYAGAGLVQEAEEILRNWPGDDEDVSSESKVWANLLGSCRFQGSFTFGERTAKSLIDKEPQNVSYYRLLLNIYAVAGKWDDVAGVKKTMKERKVGRMPGCNLVDLKEIVHEFKVGHYWREQMEEFDTMNVELGPVMEQTPRQKGEVKHEH